MKKKQSVSPPRIPAWILSWLLPQYDRQYLRGDFDEICSFGYEDKGRLSADIWYWKQVVVSLPQILIHPFIWSVIMFKNYLKMNLRNLKKHKGYSFLNIAGMSVGLACFILVLLFVRYEFRYEKHHVNAERIYRLIVEQNLGGGVFQAASSPVPLEETLAHDLPEVEEFNRFTQQAGYWSHMRPTTFMKMK